MRVKYLKTSIQIIPENDADEVYLETVLNLKSTAHWARTTRVSAAGMPSIWAYAEIKKVEEPPTHD